MIGEIPGFIYTNKPSKSFNEKLEIGVTQMIQKCLIKETRTDGEEVYVVDDLDKLIVDILEFYEQHNSTWRHSRSK